MEPSADSGAEPSGRKERRFIKNLTIPAGGLVLVVIGLVIYFANGQTSPQQTTTTAAMPTSTSTSRPPEVPTLDPVWRAIEHLEAAYSDRVDSPELATAILASFAQASEGSVDPGRLDEPIPEGVPDGFDDVWRLWYQIILDEPELEPRDLMVQAIEAMVERTGDPDAAVLVDVTVEPDGYVEDERYGIGAFVVPVEGFTVIGQPFPGGPASRAGIRSGDIVVEVDGVPVAGMGIEEVADRVRGPAGTTVSLLLERQGSDPIEVEVTRETLQLGTARFTTHPGGIGYLAVNSLEARTPAEVHDHLEALVRRDTRALILDLRGNMGGSPGAALSVASEFLSRELVYVEEHLDGTSTAHQATSGGLAVDLPMVVLIDEGTAGEAELLTAAVRYHERARVFGLASAGSAALYRGHELGEGVVIVTRSGRWLTPGGDTVEPDGVTPDQLVGLTSEDVSAGFDRPQAVANAYLWTLLQDEA